MLLSGVYHDLNLSSPVLLTGILDLILASCQIIVFRSRGDARRRAQVADLSPLLWKVAENRRAKGPNASLKMPHVQDENSDDGGC